MAKDKSTSVTETPGTETPVTDPVQPLYKRFHGDLDRLLPSPDPIGIAVSGGPDSLALLLLAAAARPGAVEAATVDHGLREGSRAEAEKVAALCDKLGVPHKILTIEWKHKSVTAIQERARIRRYGALAEWAKERGLKALLTGHHANDQAETLLMRLRRGAGLNGLAGMRQAVRVPGSDEALVRPLLGWRRDELEQICESAGETPSRDPSNEDEAFERIKIRKALDAADWIGPRAVSASAAHLADADAALNWVTNREWDRVTKTEGDKIDLDPKGLPREIRRRLMARAVASLATEGRGAALRGRQSDRLLAALTTGQKATLRGVACSGGATWTFAKAPVRKAKA
ncbi:MAG: tRNA lysidine(34) synthetase TilS [Pseudomonadota bacterium]